jgi:hypothetical protein
MTRRFGRGALPALLAFAVVASIAVTVVLFGPALRRELGSPDPGGARSAAGPATSPGPVAPTATAAPTVAAGPDPEVRIAHETCCHQTARLLDAAWSSSEPTSEATLALSPAAPGSCRATVDPGGRTGRLGCDGLLAGATDHVATLTVRTAQRSVAVQHRFRTMGDRLVDVKWFTEFEDARANPVACAAASARIVQVYTAETDPMTAEQILAAGRKFNRSDDPGLDPAAIAAIQRELAPRNIYHYYNFATKQEATDAAVYWLLRSGKPVFAITLAGQHAPLVIGFDGTYGGGPGDPQTRLTGIVVQDPQRGDTRPETAWRRPDMPRSPTYQTGHVVPLDEWYGNEWWFRFPFAGVINYAGRSVDIDRKDDVYPRPHWARRFVILVDDRDAAHPPDREGRIKLR